MYPAVDQDIDVSGLRLRTLTADDAALLVDATRSLGVLRGSIFSHTRSRPASA